MKEPERYATPPDELLRVAWRAKLEETFPYEGESYWRGADAWAPTWDRVAAQFFDRVPADLKRAHRLETIAQNLRRRLEVGFVDEDAAETDRARRLIDRILREAEIALGRPKASKKRRRYKLMSFVEECVQAGLAAWPDFDELATTADRDIGWIPATEPAPDGWMRLVDVGSLRASLAELDDLSKASVSTRNALVASWSERKPGAKKALGSVRVGAYEALHRVLTAAWGDSTSPAQLKKEWSASNRHR